MRSVRAALAFISTFLLTLTGPALAQEATNVAARVAVVVAVEDYSGRLGEASGARLDGRHVVAALEAQGYGVRFLQDPTEGRIRQAAYGLADQMAQAGPGTIGLFYFVGHGVQLEGRTYLLGSDARPTDALGLAGSGVPLDFVTEQISGFRGSHPIVVIDADAPSAIVERFGLTPGVRPVPVPDGGALIFSNQPDSRAADRRSGVSSFAAAFAEAMLSPRPFRSAARELRADVRNQTGDALSPFVITDTPRGLALGTDEGGGTSGGAGDLSDAEAPTRGIGRPRPPPIAGPPNERAEEAPTRSIERRAEPQIHAVDVFFGTDRGVRWTSSGPTFTEVTAPTLSYGVATVTIPPNHTPGELESPRWWRFEFRPNPERHVVYAGSRLLNEDVFFDAVARTVGDSTRREAFVFVHGFNTTFENAARRTAQMHHDLRFDGAPIFYSWPSRGQMSPLAYNSDAEAADRTVPRLERFLTMISQRTGAERIHLIAHSMGNRALVKALEEISENIARDGSEAPFNEIILSAPDIDRVTFEDIARQIVPTARRITLYASRRDQALLASARWNGAPRAGDLSQGRPLVLQGIETIDASNARTELFDIGHDYFANDPSILVDMRDIIRAALPAAQRERLDERRLPPEMQLYWELINAR